MEVREGGREKYLLDLLLHTSQVSALSWVSQLNYQLEISKLDCPHLLYPINF